VIFGEDGCLLFDIATARLDAGGSTVDYLFSQQTGDLVAVVEWGPAPPVCLAGPPTLTIRDPPCLQTAGPAYECAVPDASTE
jgi:hypothetical protein